MSPHIILRQREILQFNKERRSKTIVMLPMLHTIRIPIRAQNVDVQMVHTRVRVDPDLDFFVPLPSSRHILRFINLDLAVQHFLAGYILLGEFAISPL